MLPVYILVHELKKLYFPWQEQAPKKVKATGVPRKLNMPPSSVCPYITICVNFLLVYCISVCYSRKQLADQTDKGTGSGCYVSSSERTTGE
jgi:hypothetical protein